MARRFGVRRTQRSSDGGRAQGRLFARLAHVLLVLGALGGVACSGSAAEEVAARRSVERARVAVESAERAGASTTLAATRYLLLAERQLDEARARLRAEDLEGARSLATRAVADAEMASLLAREAALRDAARRTLDEASALAEEAR